MYKMRVALLGNGHFVVAVLYKDKYSATLCHIVIDFDKDYD